MEKSFIIRPDLKTTFLLMQKVNDTYPSPSGENHLLMENGNPSDLDSPDISNLDYEEKVGVTDTSEALQLDTTFVLADLLPLHRYAKGIVRFVAKVQVKRTGSTDGTIYWTKTVFKLLKFYNTGSPVEIGEVTANPNYGNETTDYNGCTAQGFLQIPMTEFKRDERLGVETQHYGYVETTESGDMRMMTGRGSGDSYLEIFMSR